jgi:hypothetical protein
MGQTIGRDAMPFAIADRRIVDYGVEVPQRIDLDGDVLRPGDRLQVADHHRFGLGQFSPSVLRTVGVAGMQDDPVAAARQADRRP